MQLVFSHDHPGRTFGHPGRAAGTVKIRLELRSDIRHGPHDHFQGDGVIGLHQHAHGLVQVKALLQKGGRIGFFFPLLPLSLAPIHNIPQIELVRSDGRTAHLVWDQEEHVFCIVDGSFLDKASAQAQGAAAHHSMGVQIQVVIVFLAEHAAFLGQAHQLLEPRPLLLGDLGQHFLLGRFPLLGDFLALFIEIE